MPLIAQTDARKSAITERFVRDEETTEGAWRIALTSDDSPIVAAALEAGCKRQLSEDLQHGQRIDGPRIENPFRA